MDFHTTGLHVPDAHVKDEFIESNTICAASWITSSNPKLDPPGNIRVSNEKPGIRGPTVCTGIGIILVHLLESITLPQIS